MGRGVRERVEEREEERKKEMENRKGRGTERENKTQLYAVC